MNRRTCRRLKIKSINKIETKLRWCGHKSGRGQVCLKFWKIEVSEKRFRAETGQEIHYKNINRKRKKGTRITEGNNNFNEISLPPQERYKRKQHNEKISYYILSFL